MNAPAVIATIAKNARESVRVALDEYRGVRLIDIRVIVPLDGQTGVLVPTKKGIALKIELLPG
jgi:Transcriptional Coactivator p15 (PC4)